MRNVKEFQGIDLNDLHRSWVAILNGGSCVKFVTRVCWMTPMGILKLSFDESFILSIRRGGIGGVVRDWRPGKVVRSFSGSLDSLDANEVAVLALLVGCHGSCRLGCLMF